MPESRLRTAEALKQAARPFIDHSVEGLKTVSSIEVVYPSAISKDREIRLPFDGIRAHTRPRPVQVYERHGDCLHCGDALVQAYPIAKFKVDLKFWVFGQFCSPGCAMGYIREANLGPQVMNWTRQMLTNVFHVTNFQVSPPRFMLKRYGGSMEKPQWAATDFIQMKNPPLCTFAMFAEVEKTSQALTEVSLRDLRRPVERTEMPAGPTPTGREPVLLKVLAESEDRPKSPTRKKATKKMKSTPSLSSFLA